MGCKETLYSGLNEREANEIVAVLDISEVSAQREQDKDGLYSVLVDAELVAIATRILMSEGLPREQFESLGQVFTSDGISATPFDQRARYIHALNQELSRTVSELGGVRAARVFVTLPEEDSLSRQTAPAKASVSVTFYEGDLARSFISNVKLLISHSVSNLKYEDVAVVLFPMAPPEAQTAVTGTAVDVQASSLFGGFQLTTPSRFLIVLAVCAALLAVFWLSLPRPDRRQRVRPDPTGRDPS